MMQAVIDTNILVSALLHPGSVPDAVIQDIVGLRLTPVVCEAVVAEYSAVLSRPRFAFPAPQVREVLALFEQLAVEVKVPPYTGQPALPDPADWPFVACALAVRSPVITGNIRHFPESCGVRAMTAREWVEKGPRA